MRSLRGAKPHTPTPQVDPGRYEWHARRFLQQHPGGKLFLATDDEQYESFMRDHFGSLLVMRPGYNTSAKNVLYDDTVNKTAKSEEVLQDALWLSFTTALAKGFSAVSEFAVYMRQAHGFKEEGGFESILDLETTDQSAFDYRVQVLESFEYDGSVRASVTSGLKESMFGGDMVAESELPNPMHANFKVFIVTLPKRREHVAHMLNVTGMAHVATLVDPTTPASVVAQGLFPSATSNVSFEGDPLTVNEAACAKSHHDAIRAYMNSGADYGLIMEDDTMAAPALQALLFNNISATSVLQKVIEARHSLERPWDVINFGRCWDCCKIECAINHQHFPHEGFNIITSPHPNCGSAYLVNHKGAAALTEGQEPTLRRQADDNIGAHGMLGAFTLMSAYPRLFMQDDNFGSTLHEKSADVECGECGGDPCFIGQNMPFGFKNLSSPFIITNLEGDHENEVETPQGGLTRVNIAMRKLEETLDLVPPEKASTLFNTPVASPEYLPDRGIFEAGNNSAIDMLTQQRLYSAIDYLSSSSCQGHLGRSLKPVLIEWGFGATVTSLVKPIIHALEYGYCLETPPPMVKYNCSSFEALFQPFDKMAATDCGAACAHIEDNVVMRQDDPANCAQAYSEKATYSDVGFPLNFEADGMKACNERYSDALKGSDALPGMFHSLLDQNGTMGYFPMVSFIQARVLRPSDAMQARINAMKQSIGWPAAGTPVLSLHYRAGDACLENPDTLGRSCEPFSEVMDAADKIARKYHIKHIFIATDSSSVMNEFSKYSNYTFLYTHANRGGVKDRVELDKALVSLALTRTWKSYELHAHHALLVATRCPVAHASRNAAPLACR
jgi:hypothetical protein